MAYPLPPQQPGVPNGKKPRLRGHTGIRVGAILSVIGLVILIIGIVIFGTQSLSKVNGFQRVQISAGAGTVNFSGTGKYVAYYEASNVTNSISELPPIQLALRDAATTQVVAIEPFGNRSDGKIKKLTYGYNGHHGAALAQFTIAKSGSYQVEVQAGGNAPSDADIAFGRSIENGTVGGSLLTIAGVLLLLAGLIVLLIGLVRRRRNKKQLREFPQQGYPSAGYPQGYPPQGYPQQGYPQPGYAPPGYPQQGGPPPGYPQQPPPNFPQQQPPNYPQQGGQPTYPPPSGYEPPTPPTKPAEPNNPWRPADED